MLPHTLLELGMIAEAFTILELIYGSWESFEVMVDPGTGRSRRRLGRSGGSQSLVPYS